MTPRPITIPLRAFAKVAHVLTEVINSEDQPLDSEVIARIVREMARSNVDPSQAVEVIEHLVHREVFEHGSSARDEIRVKNRRVFDLLSQQNEFRTAAWEVTAYTDALGREYIASTALPPVYIGDRLFFEEVMAEMASLGVATLGPANRGRPSTDFTLTSKRIRLLQDPSSLAGPHGTRVHVEDKSTHLINLGTIQDSNISGHSTGLQQAVAKDQGQVRQNTSHGISDHAFLQLAAELAKLGIAASDVNELKELLQKEPEAAKPGILSPAVAGWIGRVAYGSLVVAAKYEFGEAFKKLHHLVVSFLPGHAASP